MFRSPNDESSSEDSNVDEEIELSRASEASADPFSQADTPHVPHVAAITASLLEFHYAVRAAELLNIANPTARYDRHSPKAQALGKQMFTQSSRILASHGLLAGNAHTDELQEVRRQYLQGIDNLGVHALRDSGSLPRGSARLQLEGADIPSNGLLNPSVDPVRMERDVFLSQLGNLTISSPLSDLPLIKNPIQTFNRYRADFTELKLLGRGGFGTVHHVVHFLDNQHYAIKKIPIDPRKMKRKLQRDGQKAVESVLQEVRTLATLNHDHVVR